MQRLEAIADLLLQHEPIVITYPPDYGDVWFGLCRGCDRHSAADLKLDQSVAARWCALHQAETILNAEALR
jgi:hypothetical protein